MAKRWWLISFNTFRETIRDKLLYSLVAFAVLILGGSLLAGSVSLGQDIRVITDFGLTALLVFLLIISLFIGTQLVYREVERKTVYLVLTKTISREEWYLGKFFGLALTIAVAGLVMAIIFLGLLAWKTKSLTTVSVLAVIFIVLEAWLLTALSLLFSSFTSPIASAIYTFCFVLIGHSSATIWTIAQKASSFVKGLLGFVYYAFPNLEKFNLRNDVVFHLQPDLTQIWTTVLYFTGYTAVLLLLGLAIIRRHEF